MTEQDKLKYNKGVPIKCKCGAVMAYAEGNPKVVSGIIAIKCRKCKQINIIRRAESIN